MYAGFFVLFIVFMGVIVCIVMSVMASRQIRRESEETRQQILDILPHSDCGRCFYGKCASYALAAVKGTEEYCTCPEISEGFNRRISLMWVAPKKKDTE